jgi:hypothetical protein
MTGSMAIALESREFEILFVASLALVSAQSSVKQNRSVFLSAKGVARQTTPPQCRGRRPLALKHALAPGHTGSNAACPLF